MSGRDLPRRLAPVLFGLGNLYVGIDRLTNAPTHSKAYSYIPGSLAWWGVAFITLGVLILAAARVSTLAWAALASGLFLWTVWSIWLWQAHEMFPQQVAQPTGAMFLAALHLLLSPYRRQPRRLHSGST